MTCVTDGLPFFCAVLCVWWCGCSKERVQKIERESRAKAEKDMARINDKATPKGQFAFDTISKMYGPFSSSPQGEGRGVFDRGLRMTCAFVCFCVLLCVL